MPSPDPSTYHVPPVPDKARFRNKMNVRYYKGLFYEFSSDPSTVVYTLRDFESGGYPSLYQIYLQEADPEEFRFATTWLDNYEHWERLCSAQWFQPYRDKFRAHLEQKLKSEALAQIITDARSGQSRTAFASNKFIVERGWNRATKGRPSKDQIREAAFDLAQTEQRLLDDYNRATQQGSLN
jgi:hypothetical protein